MLSFYQGRSYRSCFSALFFRLKLWLYFYGIICLPSKLHGKLVNCKFRELYSFVTGKSNAGRAKPYNVPNPLDLMPLQVFPIGLREELKLKVSSVTTASGFCTFCSVYP